MEATTNEPMLSVHSIAEYTFCPRAGLLAYENKREESDDDIPSLYALPRFEIQAIEREIVEQRQWLFRWLATLLGCSIAGPFGVWLRQYWILILTGVAMVYLSYQAVQCLMRILELLSRRDFALSCECIEPNPTSTDMQPVNWFGMLKHGFESVRLEEPLQDMKWRLAGKPWRILRKGSLTIPVFKTRTEQEQPREPQIAKIMAYCRLCEECIGGTSPYGIILSGTEFSGFAVPNSEEWRQDFHDSVVALRQLAVAADNRGEGEVSYDGRKCSRCPLGEPQSSSIGSRVYRFGAPLPVFSARGSSGYRSDCGDRFEWSPPYNSNDS